MMKSIIGNRKGSAIMMGLLVLMLLSVLGLAFLSAAMTSITSSKREYLRAKSLNVAQAGVEKAISYIHGTAPDGTKDGSWHNHPSADPDDHSADDWETLYLAEGESCKFCIRTAAGADHNRVVITSISTVTQGEDTASRTLEVMVKRTAENVSPWNNVIFAGVGQTGKSINGNVVMRGSVHLLGDGEEFTDLDHDQHWDDNESYTDSNHNGNYDLGETYTDADGDGHRDAREPFIDANGNGTRDPALKVTDLATESSGTADIGNNYNGMSAGLRGALPDPPTKSFGGETVDTLSAKLRVKNGLVSLSGTATVGWGNTTGNSIKETMDGVYVTDGYSGNKGSANVYADNGLGHAYDLGDGIVTFPSLYQPYKSYPTYQDYLYNDSFVKSGALDIGGTSFSFGDAKGSLSYDAATGLMEVKGKVYVQGDIKMSGGTHRYSGSGTLVSTGNIDVDCNLLPLSGYPVTNKLGLIAAHDMTIGSGAQRTVAAACYAQYKISIPKQTELAGSCVSNYFSMQNVPHLYQVPALADNLPPGLPGGDPIWIVSVDIISWQDKSGSGGRTGQ